MPPAGSEDETRAPAPGSRGALGRARTIANRAFAETIVVETNGHGDGHGNGHGPADQHAAVGTGHGELPGGEGDEEGPDAASGDS